MLGRVGSRSRTSNCVDGMVRGGVADSEDSLWRVWNDILVASLGFMRRKKGFWVREKVEEKDREWFEIVF